jgi:hypothetical protein
MYVITLLMHVITLFMYVITLFMHVITLFIYVITLFMYVITLFSFVSHADRISVSHKTASKTNPFIHMYSCILYKTENNCPYLVSSSHNPIHYKKNDSLTKWYTTNTPLDYKKIHIIYKSSNNLIA